MGDNNSSRINYNMGVVTTDHNIPRNEIMNITEKSNKADIIDEAVVIITEQDEKISNYRQERRVLVGIISLLFVFTLF